MASDERAELRGKILDERYRLGACIGVGGTGVVFEALRLADGHPVVVKMLRPVFALNADLARRLRREGEVFRTVGHPGLVPVLDEGLLADGSPYLVLERIWGESLSRLIKRWGSLGVGEVATIGMRVASILHSVHRHGYVHRDIKPEHILLDRNAGGGLELTLLDFGVCAAPTAPREERDREKGRVFGTPSYVSPEQASGNPDVDGRADVYGLGVVLFESLSGRVPFTATDVMSLLRRIIVEEAPSVALYAPHVDAGLEWVVGRALARQPEQRFSSMRTLFRALAPFVGDRLRTEHRLAQNLCVGDSLPEAIPTLRDVVAA